MTIEQKAKAYDEALEKMREFMLRNPQNNVIQKNIKDAFPELKDGNDERVRKELIIYLSDMAERTSFATVETDCKRWLAWLEKQKPMNLTESPSKEFILNVWELGNYWKELTKGLCNTEHGTQLEYIQKHWKEGGYYDKIQTKQKPVECRGFFPIN